MTEPQFTLSESDLRDLASELQKDRLGFAPATFRKAVIAAVNLTSTPPKVSIQLSGDSTVIPDVRIFRNYVPVVNDTALILKQGPDLLALGTVAGSSYWTGTTDFVRYERTTNQTISNNLTTKANFTSSTDTDTGTITVSGGTDFTLVRGGIVTVESTVPWQGGAVGQRWAVIGNSDDNSIRYADGTLNPNNGAFPIHNVSVTRRFAAGTKFSIYVYQDTGATLALGPGVGLSPLDVNITYHKP